MQGHSSDHAKQRLLELLLRITPHDGVHVTKVPKLKLVRVSGPTALGQVLYQPGLCLLAQGSKQLLVGDARIAHDSTRHMVFAHDVRVSGQVAEASPEKPYLCVWLDIDPAVVSSLLLEDAH